MTTRERALRVHPSDTLCLERESLRAEEVLLLQLRGACFGDEFDLCRYTIVPMTLVDVALFVGVASLTVPDVVSPLALVSATVGINERTVAVSAIVVPRSVVLCLVLVNAFAMAVPGALFPETVVDEALGGPVDA